MDKVTLYRKVLREFSALCQADEQPCSFRRYCREHGVEQSLMPWFLAGEYFGVNSIPNYRKTKSIGLLCNRIYRSYKELCAEGRQPGTFTDFCKEFGITRPQMSQFLHRNKLKVSDIPGYIGPNQVNCKSIPFENVIFEEAGFLPAGDANVITVSVDGHVAVRFPADTDVAVIAKFVKRMGKEAGHVES